MFDADNRIVYQPNPCNPMMYFHKQILIIYCWLHHVCFDCSLSMWFIKDNSKTNICFSVVKRLPIRTELPFNLRFYVLFLNCNRKGPNSYWRTSSFWLALSARIHCLFELHINLKRYTFYSNTNGFELIFTSRSYILNIAIT